MVSTDKDVNDNDLAVEIAEAVEPSSSSAETYSFDSFSSSFASSSAPSFIRKLSSSVSTWEVLHADNNKNKKRAYKKRPSTILNLNATSPVDTNIISSIAKHLRGNFLFISLDHATTIKIAQKFKVYEYEVGVEIIGQGSTDDDDMHYYILADGECAVFKDGKQVKQRFGKIEKGTAFGENGLLFGTRTASIVASKPSEETGTVVVYCLEGVSFRKLVGDEEVQRLQKDISGIESVVNMLSGVDTKAQKGTIIEPYKPNSIWLWRKWSSTVLQYVWKQVLLMVVLTVFVGIIFTFALNHPGVELQMEYIGIFWARLSPLTTFVITFFLNQSYSFWREFYLTARGSQGRFKDIHLILASNAASVDGNITDGANRALQDIGRLGLSYLRSKQMLSSDEYESLIQYCTSDVGAPWFAALTWYASRIEMAIKEGEIELSTGATTMVYEILVHLRRKLGHIPDICDGRMPFAYVHFVSLMVGVLVFLSPFAFWSLLGWWAVPCVGIFTLFYVGILKLSMMFLDPVDNDTEHHKRLYQTVGFDVAVLIREAEVGSLRFERGADTVPQYAVK